MLICKDFQTVGWWCFRQMSFWDQSLRVWAAACFYEFVTNRSATPPMLTSIGYKCAIGPRGYRKPPFSHTGPAVGVQTNICRWGLIPVETSGIVLLTTWCKAFFSFWHKKQRRWWSSFSMALHAKGVWGHLKWPAFLIFWKFKCPHGVETTHPHTWGLKYETERITFCCFYYCIVSFTGKWGKAL